MINDGSFLFHGSPVDIKDGVLKAHRGRNPEGGQESNSFGIYATSDYPTAMVYSMDARRTTIMKPKLLQIEYSTETIVVQFENCVWTRKPGFVYKIPSETFVKNSDFEYLSLSDVNILEKIPISVSDIEGMISSGKLVIFEDKLPASPFLRFFLIIIDVLVKTVAKIGYLFSLVQNKLK